MNPFLPCYLFPQEYKQYGLPSSSSNSDIDGLVLLASTMLDEACGRTDGDGNGSLVYTTYYERLLSQSIRRNIFLIPKRPLVALTQAQVNGLSGQMVSAPASGNFFYTGALPSVNTLLDGRLSSIIGVSGRYTYGRRDNYASNDAYQQFLAPMALTTLSGGPAAWQSLDPVNLDYDSQTGEAWLATGSSILGYNYDEVIIQYTSGFDPNAMPRQIKMATAALVKNLMAKGSGTTGMRSFNDSKSGVSAMFDPDVIDLNIKRLIAFATSIRVT